MNYLASNLENIWIEVDKLQLQQQYGRQLLKPRKKSAAELPEECMTARPILG